VIFVFFLIISLYACLYMIVFVFEWIIIT